MSNARLQRLLALAGIAMLMLAAACVTPQEQAEKVLPTTIPTPTIEPTATGTPLAGSRAARFFRSELYNGSVFKSEAEYNQVIEGWESRRPAYPGLSLFTKGAAAGVRLINSLGRFGTIRNDKWQHCVWGAAIAVSTDLETATYHAWLKESRDLTDGDISTSFDEIDYDATVDGARQSMELRACDECADVCEARWGSRSLPWSGLIPASDS